MTKIVLQIGRITTDPTQYKPYNPEFYCADKVDVVIDVPDEHWTEHPTDDGMKALTIDGVSFICKTIADSLDQMHKKRRSEFLDTV